MVLRQDKALHFNKIKEIQRILVAGWPRSIADLHVVVKCSRSFGGVRSLRSRNAAKFASHFARFEMPHPSGEGTVFGRFWTGLEFFSCEPGLYNFTNPGYLHRTRRLWTRNQFSSCREMTEM